MTAAWPRHAILRPMELSTVNVALEVVGIASKALDSVREQSKTSKDAALKENISKLYDYFLDLKAAILRLTEENAALKTKLARLVDAAKPEIKQEGQANYYYIGQDGPFCQPCYDGDGKLARLSPRQSFAGGPGRRCHVCNKVFFEQRESLNSVHGEREWGPWS